MQWITRRITNYHSDRQSVGKSFRKQRLRHFIPMIEAVHARTGQVRILDIGGTREYWNLLGDAYLEQHNIHITLLNLPGTYTHPAEERFSFVEGDATEAIWTQLDKQNFDLIHSNSVVEHVGDWGQMEKFANNIRQFAKGYFVQTPNFWFPVEPHCMTPFFHWLPKPIRVWLVRHCRLGNWPKATSTAQAVRLVESARLLDKAMLRALFADATLRAERLFFLNKSFIAIRADSDTAPV